MEPLEIAPTEKTPRISFVPGQGTLYISGCSIPENADRFFEPLLDLVEAYARTPRSHTTVRTELTYFNSSSAKYLLDVFRCLEDVHASGRSVVVLEWCHAPDDLDMQEAGEDYRSLLEFPVELVER